LDLGLLYLLEALLGHRIFRDKFERQALKQSLVRFGVRLLVACLITFCVAQGINLFGRSVDTKALSVVHDEKRQYVFAFRQLSWAQYASIQRIPLRAGAEGGVVKLDSQLPLSLPPPDWHEVTEFVSVGWPLRWLHGAVTISTTDDSQRGYWRSLPLPIRLPDVTGHSLFIFGINWGLFVPTVGMWFLAVESVYRVSRYIKRKRQRSMAVASQSHGKCVFCGHLLDTGSKICPACGSTR
jgi:hypothetical protein